MHKVNIIGSGFSSLSASCYLADAGFEVNIFEKNASIGGRARKMVKEGFTVDMGPSWYWMPAGFDKFFLPINSWLFKIVGIKMYNEGFVIWLGRGVLYVILVLIDISYKYYKC